MCYTADRGVCILRRSAVMFNHDCSVIPNTVNKALQLLVSDLEGCISTHAHFMASGWTVWSYVPVQR